MEKFGRVVERHAETPVKLTHDATGAMLHGTLFYEYPVDIPPVVEVPSIGMTLYRDVCVDRGWKVEYV